MIFVLEDEMRAVAANLYVTTDDGSYGFHGTGTAQLPGTLGSGRAL